MPATLSFPGSYRPPRTRPAWTRYGAAAVCVGLGLLARHALTLGVGPTALPFIFFFPFIAVAAWYGGAGPATLAIALAGLAAAHFFFKPIGPQEILALAAFGLASAVIVGAIQRMHDNRADLTQSRDLLSTTLTSIGDGVIVTDAQGRISFLNPVAERLTKWTNADAAGRPVAEVFRIVNESTRLPTPDPIERVLRAGTSVGLANHTILIARDGSELPIDDSGAPIRHPGSPVLGVVLVFRDAREVRRALAARARLATIVESSGDVILSKDLDGRILTWNAAAERLLGYRADEIIGKSVLMLIPPELQDQEREILERMRSGISYERLETVRMAKDGRRIPVSVAVSPIKDPEGRVIGASKILHDITPVLEARETLAREKELLSTTLASIGDGVIVTDAQGRVSFMNGEAERLTGWATADARGRALPEVFRILNEETGQVVENPVEKVLKSGVTVGLANHTVLVRKDGTRTPIDDSAAPIRKPDGPLYGVVLVFRDFTEQKESQNEILRLNAELERRVAERTRELRDIIQELETFSYTVAHDLRGPLRAMHRSSEVLLLEQGPRLTEEGAGFLRRIEESAARMDRLIRDLLSYTRVTRAELKAARVEPSMILADVMMSMDAEIRERKAEVGIEDGLTPLQADPVLLAQVFGNLLSNALKFVPRGTAPRVRIREERRGARTRVWVEDNGIGIDVRHRERLFRLFERLDSDYPGTGIGLAIVKRAVERMGGAAGFEPGESGGSRFWIELPSGGSA